MSPPDDTRRVYYRRVEAADVDACASLHLAAFPDFFLAQLGVRFLREFYGAFVRERSSVTSLAVDAGSERIIGVAVGTAQPHGFYRRLAMRRWLRFASAAIPLLYKQPHRLPRLMRALRYRGGAADLRHGALLSSIAVDPQRQGEGIGAALLSRWTHEAMRQPVQSAYLTTDRDGNEGANRFYQAAGWKLAGTEQTPEGRWLNYYRWGSDGPTQVQPHAQESHVEHRPSVLHVVGASSFGGASRVIASVVAALADSYDVAVLTTEPRLAKLVTAQKARVVGTVEIVRPISPVKDVVAIFKLARLLRAEHVDVVHTHTSKGGAVGRIAAFLAGTSVRVHTIHNFAVSDSSGFAARTANRVAESFLGRMSTHVTTVSAGLHQAASRQHLVDRDRLSCIPNGIPDVEAVEEPDAPVPTVMYHGRLASGKGIEDLMAACKLLLDDGVAFKLRIVGDGDLASWAEESVKGLGFDPQHVMGGFVEDVHAELSSASVCVQPSHREGLSIALIEALRAARCIVASDIPANQEVLGVPPAGLIFPVGDARRLADALRTAIGDSSLRERLGVAGRSRFEETYREADMQDAYVSLYNALLSERLHPRRQTLQQPVRCPSPSARSERSSA